ncbi:hypothetical protein JCGZ_11018 [Jatropha curcas]|uniref:Uncharacterized protein n=1 Tax=Jatropha curcas TaxID=180498 RepID=A0A067KQW8_JATCU|nr:hypothetical protein JCGZ_11018 [Jatropha curcas]
MRCSLEVVGLTGNRETATVKGDSGVEVKLALIRLRERSTDTEETRNMLAIEGEIDCHPLLVSASPELIEAGRRERAHCAIKEEEKGQFKRFRSNQFLEGSALVFKRFKHELTVFDLIFSSTDSF